jgi:hypothetical protein
MNAYQWFLLGMMVDREAMRVSVCGDVLDGRIGAGEGNRTLVISLEGFCSTIELHPRQESVVRYQ